MAITNIPLSFYRSTQAKMDNLQAIQEGAFYLTTDTNRLYTGIKKGEAVVKVELNQSITVYPSISDLTSAYEMDSTQFKDGQFYYSTYENVLVLFDSTNLTNPWKQINPDTNFYAKEVSTVPTINDNVVTVTTSVTNKRKDYTGQEVTVNVAQPSDGTFTIQGGTNTKAKLNTAQTGIIIDATEYQTVVNYDNDNDNATLQLQKKDPGATNWSNVTSFTIVAGNNVQLETDENTTTISATDTRLNPNGNNYIHFDSSGALSFQVTDTSTATAGSSTTPIITYGHVDPATSGDPVTYVSTAKFDQVDGQTATLTLDTYNTTQIDDMFASKLRDFDAVKFIGQITDVTDIPNKAQSGDMYVINVSSLEHGTEIWRSGDFIIASGQENLSGQDIGYITGDNLEWILIPSGNDTITSTDIAGADGGFYLTQNGGNFNSYRTTGTGNIQVNTSVGTETTLKNAAGTALHKTSTDISLVWQDLD